MRLVAPILTDVSPIASLVFYRILVSGVSSRIYLHQVAGWTDDVVVVFRQIVPTVNDKELSIQQNVCSNSKNVEGHVFYFKKVKR